MIIKKVAHLKGHSAGIFSLEQGREPYSIFSGSSDKMVAEWSLKNISGSQSTGPLGFSIKADSFIYSICHIPSKKLLVIGLYSGAIHIFDLAEKKEIKFIALHQTPIFDLRYCKKNNSIYALSGDGSFSVWNANDYSLITRIILCREKLRNIDFDLEENFAGIACGDGSIRIFETSTHKQITLINAHGLSANCLKFHPNGLSLVSGGRDAYLRCWDLTDNFKMFIEIPAHNYAIYDISFSPEKNLFATASRDKTAKIWDSESFDFVARIDKKNSEGHTHSVNKVLWTGYQNYLITCGDDRIIMVWEVN